MISLSDVDPNSAPAGTPTVQPGQKSVTTGPTASSGPADMACPYEIDPSGTIIRRRAGSTAPAPVPCPTVTQLDNRGQPAKPTPQVPSWFNPILPDLRIPKHTAAHTPTALDPTKVAEHRSSQLTPVCNQAGVPPEYLDACITYLQGRGATIAQFMQMLANDPAAVAAIQQQTLMALAAGSGGGSKLWWILGGLAAAGVVTTGVVLFVRHRRAAGGRRGGRGLHGAELDASPVELVREYNQVVRDPGRHSPTELRQLATRLEVVGSGAGRQGLARRAEKLRELVAEREAA